MNRGSLSRASSLKVVADSLLWENRLKIVAGPPPEQIVRINDVPDRAVEWGLLIQMSCSGGTTIHNRGEDYRKNGCIDAGAQVRVYGKTRRNRHQVLH